MPPSLKPRGFSLSRGPFSGSMFSGPAQDRLSYLGLTAWGGGLLHVTLNQVAWASTEGRPGQPGRPGQVLGHPGTEAP